MNYTNLKSIFFITISIGIAVGVLRYLNGKEFAAECQQFDETWKVPFAEGEGFAAVGKVGCRYCGYVLCTAKSEVAKEYFRAKNLPDQLFFACDCAGPPLQPHEKRKF